MPKAYSVNFADGSSRGWKGRSPLPERVRLRGAMMDIST